MPHEVIMPALGMAQETGLIVTWFKSAGDPVASGDALFEVETDKATMEVEAQADGYLTDVSAAAGDEVKVGSRIALISEDAEGSGEAAPKNTEPEPAVAPAAAPSVEGKDVIMPALGMAQDTGLIVAWHKAPGDAVETGEILFEVETDKATQEVEAASSGYLTARFAQEGEAAPVGSVIAVISAEAPENPVDQSLADATPSASKPAPEAATPAPAPAPDTKSAPAKQPAPTPRSNGRILASPKARRIAAEEGLDLALLLEAGHPEPFHVKDLDTLRQLAKEAPAVATGAGVAAGLRLEAEVPAGAFDRFLSKLSASDKAPSRGAILATFAASALRNSTDPIRVSCADGDGRSQTYRDPDLGGVAEEDGAPDLLVRDLTGSFVTSASLGAGAVPSLTLTRRGGAIVVVLDAAPDRLSPDAAVALLTAFAARIDDPLRALL
ncbi:pyruvate dehydrogenase [Rhodobacterales bacterium HKCCE3408]|nr:pyruvate dehydrogenase [Rhodobacterales bacterium HKCCE3408]